MNWLAAYGQSWQNGDADAVITIFSHDAHETPSDEPMIGRHAIHNYWRKGATESQTNTPSTYQPLAIVENAFARLPSHNRIQPDGFLTADFNPTGQRTTLHEWWHRRETEIGKK